MIDKIFKGLSELGLLASVLYGIEKYFKIILPLNPRLRWKINIKSEVSFWDKIFKTKGLDWPEDYKFRIDPDSEVSNDIGNLIMESDYKILDVGAGPLTLLGKTFNGKKLNITAVDPLAKYYDDILRKNNIKPIVHTQQGDAEKLGKQFSENSFDLVTAFNCIDHAYSPETAILEMLKVVKRGGHVFMKHAPNEAIKENWFGLHQWNFSEKDGDFIISDREKSLNFSNKYDKLCKISCSYDQKEDRLVTKILKL